MFKNVEVFPILLKFQKAQEKQTLKNSMKSQLFSWMFPGVHGHNWKK